MPEAINKIEVIGAGAMGAFYASKLFDMDDNSIALIAKGDRYDRLKESGLTVNSRLYPFRVIKPDDPSPPADLIIVAVKHHHLGEVIEDIKDRIGENSRILSVMNGIDSEEMIGATYGMNNVIYGSAMGTFATRDEKHITIKQEGKLLFGEADNTILSDGVKRMQHLFDSAGIIYETPKDMIRTLWLKFMINVGINQVSAAARAANLVLQSSQEAKALMSSAMGEVLAIAKAAHVDLSESDIKNFYPFLSGLSPAGKTSMLQDVEAERKTEVEMFAGKVIEFGKRYDIPTPVNQTLFRIIKTMEKTFGQ